MKKENYVPWRQALCNSIECALDTYKWLEDIYRKRSDDSQLNKEVVIYGKKERILCDAFSGYLTTILSGGGKSSYSLSNNAPNLYKKLKDNDVVGKAHLNRHNRFAHQSKNPGFFIYTEDIIGSGIDGVLNELIFDLLRSR